MPFYHFTIHAYRSWHEDDSRGYVQRGESGTKIPNPKLAIHRDRIASDDEVRFTIAQMKVLLDAVKTTCERKRWRPHAAAATATHIHIVASWEIDVSPEKVQEGLKSGLGYCLSKAKGTTGNRWFSRGGPPQCVEDHAHLFQLRCDYLPKHASEQGGLFRDYEQEAAHSG